MNKKVGVLIIHGFAGGTNDIEPLNDYLLSKGFTTLCTKLKGHTGRRRDLSKSNYIEWVKSAEKSLIEISSQCEKVIIIGFSMGGLIAANLAKNHNISGIITLSTPIYYWDIKRICLNIVKDFKTRKFKTLKRYSKSVVNISFSAMINFKILLTKTKGIFNEINCPIFVIQGLLDDVVHYRSADYIYSNVSSKEKIIKYYNNSNHIICKSDDRNEVFKDIFNFIKENFVDNL